VILPRTGQDHSRRWAIAAAAVGVPPILPSSSYTLEGHELRSTPSIGVVLFGAEHRTINDLLRQADMAMYEAKAAGRATFRFDPRMQVALDASATLEADLRFALQRDELRLYYQPVVGLRTGNVVTGVEALLRWQHPQRLDPAGDFIPQAEKSGLIVELGAWVLDAACRQLVRWSGDASAHLSMAVNKRARQFRCGWRSSSRCWRTGRTG
jgi:predicted signal transduction protein with EAL and GGDEF domain